MSQYGAPSKNPPWVRNSGVPNQQSIQSQMMGPLNTQGLVYQQPPQMFQSPLGMQQSANMMSPINSGVSMSQLGASQQQLYGASATVSYPVPRSLNSSAFSGGSVNPSAPPVGQSTSPSATGPPKQRVFTGTVTKVHDNFGFVDEDIFFQMSCCVKGSNPVIGDRVLVEASFNPSMPFKWNATRLQVLPMGNANIANSLTGTLASNIANNISNNLGSNIPASLANALNIPTSNLNNLANNPPNNMANNLANNSGRKGFCNSPNSYNVVPPPMDINNSNSGSGNNYSRSRVSPRRERPRQQPVRERERDRKEEEDRRRRREERSKESSKEERSSHSTRSPSSQRRRSKSPRAKRRPRPTPRYMVHVPKIALDVPEADVLELRRRYNSLYIPSDFFASNFRWVDAFPPNSPFTLDRSCLFHMMHRDAEQVTENKAALDPPDADYLFSAKVMLMSMPDMDEFVKKCCQMTEDLESESEGRDFVHPTRLVNFLVGLRGKNETMAIGGPWSKSLDGPDPEKDPQVLIRTAIRNCQALTGIDLSTCTQWYRFLEIYYRRGETTHKGKVVAARVETVVLFLPDVWSCVPTRLEWDALHLNYKRHAERKLKALLQCSEADDIADEKEAEEVSDVTKKEPTHWSKLDPKVMQVAELRQELEARSLASKGLKSQLSARLQKVLKQEQDAESKVKEEASEGDCDAEADDAAGDAAAKDPDPEPSDRDNDKDKREDEEKKKQVERDRASLEKRYELPQQPHIIVHPNRAAKSGKFDCTTMSLSLLLDYRQDDTKEHSFEVSLFAELFNEMLMRDAGFRIYRALYDYAERNKDDDKEKERKKKDEKDKKEKDDRDDKKKTDEDKDDKEKEKDEAKEKEKNSDKSSEGSDKERRKDDKDEKKDKDKDKDKKKKDKVVTTDPLLLLAFVYFDQTHCGYILDKDLEELLYALGLNLSRAQVKRIVQGVLTKDSRESRENREALYYRRLTDRPKTEENKDGSKSQAASVSASAISVPSGENLESIAFGNKRLLPVFSTSNGGPPPTKRARRDSQDESEAPQGFVMYKGGLLDVEKLMSQLKRSEKARSDTESTLTQLREELNNVNKSASSSANKVNDLSTELNDSKEKLKKAMQDLSSVQARAAGYWATLKDVHSRLSEVVVKKEEPKSEPMDTEEKPNASST